jgi:outer membrane immunogenic protein
MLRSIVSAAVLVFAGLGGAAAADLPDRIPTKAPAAAPSLTSCYVGGHVGAAVSDDSRTNRAGNTSTFSSTGAVVGGQIGCDYSFAPNWIVGVEGRAAWSSLNNTHASSVTNLITGLVLPSQISLRNDFLASATARLGYQLGGHWLVFGRGGAAWTREKQDDAFVLPAGLAVDPSATSTRTGWTAGGGVEWAFAPHWSTVVEYKYYDFGSKGVVLNSPTGVFVNLANVKDTIQETSIGVNYHF